jgi:hypothetical protein
MATKKIVLVCVEMRLMDFVSSQLMERRELVENELAKGGGGRSSLSIIYVFSLRF